MNVTDFTKNSKCSNCGECCSDYIPMTLDEVKKIKNYIKRNSIKEQRKNLFDTSVVDMTCPFRDHINHKCLIYEVRPLVCRKFLCNKSLDELQDDKLKMHTRGNPVSMRWTFYNDPSNRLDRLLIIK